MNTLLIICVAVMAALVVFLFVGMQSSRRRLDDTVEKMRNDHQRELQATEERTRRDAQERDRMLLERVEALSQKLAVGQADRISAQSNREMQNVVEPLRRHLENFDRLMRESADRENSARAQLKGQIDSLIALNQSIGDEARQLTQALKGDSKVQGDWGEMQLTTLLEQAGLEQGIHFRTQVTRDESGRVIRSEEGGDLRPDVIVNLPDDKKLIIDSKVSLTAYADYASAEDKEQRRVAARRHLDSVRKHIRELAAKHYPDSIQGACDQSLMFLPLEGAFTLAVSLDADLLRFAASLKVAIVTPVHLYSVVQLAAQLWRQDAQDRNTLEIAQAGGRLYDKLAIFLETFDKVGETLRRSQEQYDQARKQISTGKGNLLSRAEKLRALGAKTTKNLPKPDDNDNGD
ncbi:MAG: DNA recombination protein RmuC [Lepagella sp.]